MKVCPQCREENSDRARFCQACATPLAGSQRGEARKVVTILYSDIVGSTGIGARLGPESFRRVMQSYYEVVRSVVDRHQGTIEKFIGDAAMVVFGIPEIHEDDALRAVRAAFEMRAELAPLNRELSTRWGVSIRTRTAIDTGEVVAGDVALGQALVTGDAVHVAARLESEAGANEILVGRDTFRLIKDFVRAEPLGSLPLKGLPVPVAAWRIEELRDESPTLLRFDTPLVGRDNELGLLYDAFERVATKRQCEVFTVLGGVGVGKTRLAIEFSRGVQNDALVLRGRCPAYGESSTFWPFFEVVRQAAEISEHEAPADARRKIRALLGDRGDAHETASGVAQLVGLGELKVPARQRFHAARRFLEVLSSQGPVVLLLDDIQWAQSTFLDLIKYLAAELRETPVLLVCVARTELLETHPRWVEEDSTGSALLAPLSDAECTRLVEYVLGRSNPTTEAQAEIVRSAQGNPLFLQETLAMLIDDGLLVDHDGRYVLEIDPSDIQIPPTIQALLAARIDRLSLDERRVLESASVVGELFYTSDVAHLVGRAADALHRHLGALTRKEMIGPERSRFSDDSAYRFHHTLLRDVAYDGLPRDRRAALHEEFARHLEVSARGWSRSYQEVVGYHYERSHGYRRDLSLNDFRTRELALRASDQLAAAGRKAHAGRDMPAAVDLLRRALALMSEQDDRRAELLPVLAESLADVGDFDDAYELATEAIQRARAMGHRGLESYALTVLVRLPRKPGFRLSLGYGISSEEGFRQTD